MSWRTAGKLVSGPPTASGSGSTSTLNDKRYKPNLGGLNAFQREQQFASHYSSKGKGKGREEFRMEGRTDWDVLKENHRFIRDDEEPTEVSWEERLARAYESKLFKEFALIDLKHYKSRRLALRWRTAEEVVEEIGEDTCGSLRCKYHKLDSDDTQSRDGKRKRNKIPILRSFELPFAYIESGERKEALVKVRLCRRCEGKLCWKPDQGQGAGTGDARSGRREVEYGDEDEDEDEDSEDTEDRVEQSVRKGMERRDRYGEETRRERSSSGRARSKSPDIRRQRRRPRSPESRSRSSSPQPRTGRDGRNLI